jgi:predicted transcriptional regulator
MALSIIRQGELALMYLKLQISEKPISAPNEIKRDLGNIAKKLGIELSEMLEFAKPLYEEALAEGFKGGKIVITKKTN